MYRGVVCFAAGVKVHLEEREGACDWKLEYQGVWIKMRVMLMLLLSHGLVTQRKALVV